MVPEPCFVSSGTLLQRRVPLLELTAGTPPVFASVEYCLSFPPKTGDTVDCRDSGGGGGSGGRGRALTHSRVVVALPCHRHGEAYTAIKAKTTAARKGNDRHDLVSANAIKAKTTAAGKRNQTYMTLSAPQATAKTTAPGKRNDRHDLVSATSHCH